MDLTGLRLGSWLIREKLGSGGQGAVWLAVKSDISGGEVKAAVKTLYGSAIADPAQRRMLTHEHDMLRDLTSAYIARYLDSGQEVLESKGGKIPIQWIALEMVAGQSLAEEIRTAGILDEFSWLELAHDTLAGLSALHAKGIIHSDIKPGNIMRSSRKSVIVDLGAASVVGIRDAGDQSPTWTVEYAAPEQFDPWVDAKDYGYEIDIFSLGMTLVFAATGAPAWDEVYRDKKSVNKESIRAHYEAIRDQAPRLTGLTPKQREIVSQMLKFSPNQRVPAATLLKQVKELLPEGSARKQEQVAEQPVRWVPQNSNTNPARSRSYVNSDESQPKWGMTVGLAFFGYGIGQFLRLSHFNSNEIWRIPTRRAEYIFMASVAHLLSFGVVAWITAKRWIKLGAPDIYKQVAIGNIASGVLYVVGAIGSSLMLEFSDVYPMIGFLVAGVAGMAYFGTAIYLAVPPKEALES
jgi:serine/threonine protein kinase